MVSILTQGRSTGFLTFFPPDHWCLTKDRKRTVFFYHIDTQRKHTAFNPGRRLWKPNPPPPIYLVFGARNRPGGGRKPKQKTPKNLFADGPRAHSQPRSLRRASHKIGTCLPLAGFVLSNSLAPCVAHESPLHRFEMISKKLTRQFTIFVGNLQRDIRVYVCLFNMQCALL